MTNRNILALAAIAFAAASGSAFAQEATSDAWMNAASTKTRTDVMAELNQARADGSIRAVSAGYMNPIVSQKSRADVRAEVLTATRSGELVSLNAEAHAFGTPATPATMARIAQAAR